MADTEAVKSEIQAASTRLEELWAQKDLVGLSQLYAKDICLMASGHDVVFGRQDMVDFLQTNFFNKGLVIMTLTTEEIIYATGDAAVDRSSYTLGDANKEVKDNGKCLTFWKKEEGRWMMRANSFNTSRT